MSNEYHLSSEDLVESLVDAVSRDGDFKQLSSYSIQCISKRLDYKHPEFCDLLNRVIDTNTGDAIMRVMLQHSTEKEITESCLECLSKLYSDPQTADKILHFILKEFLPYLPPNEGTSSLIVELLATRFTEYPHLLEQMEACICKKSCSIY